MLFSFFATSSLFFPIEAHSYADGPQRIVESFLLAQALNFADEEGEDEEEKEEVAEFSV